MMDGFVEHYFMNIIEVEATEKTFLLNYKIAEMRNYVSYA